MRVPRIYTAQILSADAVVLLDGDTSHYLTTVLRMKPGRDLTLFDGRGGEYDASIDNIRKKLITVRVGKFRDINPESRLEIKLGICLIKNDSMDWLLQKATELGATEFVPLFSDFTEIKLPKERVLKKLHHWKNIIRHACQQSGRTRLPSIAEPLTFSEWLTVSADQKYILHPYQAQTLAPEVQATRIALLAGPEGGFSETEFELARQHQFVPLSLGPRILRAETAPLCALSLIQHQLGDV
ncbi:MAG: 16S rRNA (uracil1498-N3)-methyltransferase [Cellvibrionaceae bacterium]|jgi:16S rRNA (uracil1498-N3)-methyltransferase